MATTLVRYLSLTAVVLYFCLVFCENATHGQEAIRVETNQVLVPVRVIDAERNRSLYANPTKLDQAIAAGDTKLAEHILEETVFSGLTAVDFEIFEDGKRQQIRSVSYRHSLYWDLRDNQGHHTEFAGPGGGKWSTAEWPVRWKGDLLEPYYLLAYSPPESEEGSCHRIKVKVGRRNALVTARSEYCNVRHPTSDPLQGTHIGNQMDSALFATKTNSNSIHMVLVATQVLTTDGTNRVHIVVEWPWDLLRRGLVTKNILLEVLASNGNQVARFSDLSDRDGIPDRIAYRDQHNDDFLADVIETVDRYERQVTLPTGEYKLGVVLSDGKIFGRMETSITVEGHDGKELAISPISLCKQIVDISGYLPHRAHDTPDAAAIQWFADYQPLVSNNIEFKPTGDARFKKGQILYPYFEIFDPLLEKQSSTSVQVQIRVVDAKTGEVKSDDASIDATSYSKSQSPVISIGRGIDISKLPAGLYRLEVQVIDSAGKSTRRRTADFAIE